MIVEPKEPIYSVAQLNGEARLLLEMQLGMVWVMGELSNLATPSSGHLYFTLKDSDAQVRCAFFRANRARLLFLPENGQQVIAKAHVSLYESRGDYQLIVSELQPAGSGALQVAFEKLKKKLQEEGLFDLTRKKSIPNFVQKVGVITSPSGAAIHDVLKVLRHRNPSIYVIIYPSLVQGADGKTALAAAIALANQRHECDVLLLARGGGSLEDLWPFNEELVARAIAASDLPIVTGIGHEVDVTIADLVADYRAPTPSAAAEYVSIHQSDILQQLAVLQKQLNQHLHYLLQTHHHRLNQLKTRLRHPGDRLREQTQRLDYLEQQLHFAMKNKLTRLQTQWIAMQHAIYQYNPLQKIERYQHQFRQLMTQSHHQITVLLRQKQDVLHSLAQQLDALSPLATLQRGYAIVTDARKNLITSVHSVTENDSLSIQLSDGSIECTAKEN